MAAVSGAAFIKSLPIKIGMVFKVFMRAPAQVTILALV